MKPLRSFFGLNPKKALKKITTWQKCPEHGSYQATEIWLGDELKSRDMCPVCAREQEKREVAELEEKRKEEIRQRQIDRREFARIPLEYREKGFDDFVCTTASQAKALDLSKRFVRGWEKAKAGGYGLFFIGNCGTGKTHLACAILQALIDRYEDFSPYYYRTSEVFSAVRRTYIANAKFTEEDVIKRFCSMDLLVLDEIGVQKGSEAERRTLFAILDTRMGNKKPTILLTNLKRKELEEVIGERLYDRIRSKCVPFVFQGESMRPTATAELFD